MKKCRKCQEDKETDAFSKNKVKADGLNDYCRECNKKYQKEHYAKHKQVYLDNLQERRKELSDWFQELKSGLECEICGENHPATLDFHHKDPSQKEFEVGAGSNSGYSRETILEEIAKCHVWCSNCHRKWHWEERMAHSSTG